MQDTPAPESLGECFASMWAALKVEEATAATKMADLLAEEADKVAKRDAEMNALFAEDARRRLHRWMSSVVTKTPVVTKTQDAKIIEID